MMKRVTINYEFLATEKERKVQEIKVELENTQKNLKLLNFGTTKLDHLLTFGQSNGNRHGLGYTEVGNNIITAFKIVFVKVAQPTEVSPVSVKIFNQFTSRGKMKKFVPICLQCNMPSHIRPRCLNI